MSTGFPTGNFRPFSEALVKGYARLMPDVRIEPSKHAGRCGNIEALQDGTVDLGLSQAGIAYMAYNGRLRESGRALRGIRGIAILNSSAVHLLVGPGSSDSLDGRTPGTTRRHGPCRQRRRSHIAGIGAMDISRRATYTKSTLTCPTDQQDAAGRRARCRVHDLERSQR